jgi:DNA primase
MKDILLDIVTISECLGLDLKKMGDRYVCSCPLHKDDTPSFTIYPKTNSFFCYSCHTGGTPLELAKILEPNIRTWSDLVRWYNTVINNDIPVRTPYKYSPPIHKVEELLNFEEEIVLPESELSKDPFLAEFSIRYTDKGRSRGRHIIPIMLDNKLIAYEARCFSGNLTPKTLILPVSVRIHSYLWNYDNLVNNLPIIVVEGIKGALAVISFGYFNVVSSFGAKLTGDQVMLLLTKTPTEVIVAYDGDSAGDLGADDAISQLLAWTKVSRVYLPKGTDPWDVEFDTWKDSVDNRVVIENQERQKEFLERFKEGLF